MADLPGRMAIAGPPCSGKTTVGEILAGLAGCPFVDLDSEVEREAGLPVPSIFARYGEEGFREMERSSLLAALRRSGRFVMALGGGTLLDPRNLAAVMTGSCLITLRVPADTLVERLAGSGRPLSGDRDGLSRLLAGRKEHYESLPGAVDCAGLSPQGCAEAIVAMLNRKAGS